MTLLYLSYWGVDDGLTVSTVFPNLEILAKKENISSIHYCSIERGTIPIKPKQFDSKKITHIPLYSKNIRPSILNKINDFVLFPKILKSICIEKKVSAIIARGAPAGSLAWMVHKRLHIPYYVESFEPHAEYMLDSGVWGAKNPKYLFEKYWENKQKESAEAIITVSHNYKKALVKDGVSANKVHVVPCCVNLEKFQFDNSQRTVIRNKLQISGSQFVAIYVGKFGGIYYDKDAFKLMKESFNFFGPVLELILLTPQSHDQISEWLGAYDIPSEKVHIKSVLHSEVPSYLSAADFAFSFHKSTNHSFAFSPIKNGEYWASGLPIVISEGIGDDSEIVVKENGGAIFTPSETTSNDAAFNHILTYYKSGNRMDVANQMYAIAHKHRNFSLAESVYSKLFDHL